MPLFPLGIDVFSGNMISKHFLNESILLQFLHCLQKCAGHAESGPDGQDIVCAAVSALTITTVNGLERVLKKEATVTQDVANGGYLEVTYIDQGHDAQLILRVFASGLMDLQERYGEFLEVKMFY